MFIIYLSCHFPLKSSQIRFRFMNPLLYNYVRIIKINLIKITLASGLFDAFTISANFIQMSIF